MSAEPTDLHTTRRGLPPVVGLVFWLVLLPLLLAILGFWQLDRSQRTHVEVKVAGQQMERTLAEIRPIAAETPNAMIQFEGGRAFPASMAVAGLENAIGENDLLLWVSMFRHPFAYLTIGSGVLALAGGLLGLLSSNIAGLRARRSRDHLVKGFTRLRIALPFMLAAVMLGLGFGGLGAALFETMTLPFWGDISGNVIKLGFAGIALAGLGLYCAITAVRGLRSVFALVEPEPIIERARVVRPEDAPALWDFVRDLATRVDAELPDTIVMGLTNGFYVTESPVRLFPEDRVITGRTLHVPAPLLELLDTTEVAAIIGHELAHFAGEDTRYSQRFVPIYSSLQRSVGALDQTRVNGDLGVGAGLRLGYHALSRFDTAVAHWSRLREFEADRRGSLASGPAGAASALLRSHVSDAAVDFVFRNAFDGQGNFGPDLVSDVAALTTSQGFSDPTDHLEDRQPHPTDSHPPTIQRIAALGVGIDEGLLSRATRRPEEGAASFGRDTFADWDGFCRQLSAEFLQNAATLQAAYLEELQTVASGVEKGEVILFENAGPVAKVMAVAAGLCALAPVSIVLFPTEMGFENDPTTQTILVASLGACTFVCLVFFVMFKRRAKRPLMVLTPDVLRSHWLSAPVRWQDVVGYQVYAAQRLALQLTLAEGVTLPSRTRFSFYNKIRHQRRIVDLDSMGIRGMTADEFSELVGRYIQAAHARRALSEENE